MQEFTVNTRGRTQFVNITREVARAVSDLKIRDGVVTVFVPHTTAGITINESADPAVTADIAGALERLVPRSAGYRHCEGNSAAHIKASLTGSSVNIPAHDGRLRLGTWQAIYFCEFDGPRDRSVWVTGDCLEP